MMMMEINFHKSIQMQNYKVKRFKNEFNSTEKSFKTTKGNESTFQLRHKKNKLNEVMV